MKKQYLHGVLPLLIFALFATALLSVLVAGARIYASLSERDDEAFTYRTAAQYVSAKVNQTEHQDEITVESFGGTTALVLPAVYDDTVCLTRLYCYDGHLYELFSFDGIEMFPEDGEKILPLSDFSASIEDELLIVDLDGTDGKTTTLRLHLEGGEVTP